MKRGGKRREVGGRRRNSVERGGMRRKVGGRRWRMNSGGRGGMRRKVGGRRWRRRKGGSLVLADIRVSFGSNLDLKTLII